MRIRVIPGHVIRLPASLLGPLGADFDGDTVALFADVPGSPPDLEQCTPVALAQHPLRKEAMFAPGKQYRHGLHRLAQDTKKFAALQTALAQAKAPPWPPGDDALKKWLETASASPKRQGRWWAI